MPMPALAPSRQRSPILMTSLPPPESVPMIDEPPPTSLPSPTTTPALMRPSTIEAPPGPEPAPHPRVPERAGVVVHEAFVHDRRALRQVRAEPHAVRVGHAHPGG